MNYAELQINAYKALSQSHYSDAEILYKQCIEIEPDERKNYWYLGIALLLQDKGSEAQSVWLTVLFSETIGESDTWLQELVDLLHVEAFNYQQAGYLKQAEKIYWQILQHNSDSAEVNHCLGTVLADQGKLADAIAFYQKALNLQPDYAEAHINLGLALLQEGAIAEAIGHHYKAVLLAPEESFYLKLFAICIRSVTFSSITPAIIQQIEKCFEIPDLGKNNLLGVTLNILKLDTEFQQVLDLANNQKVEDLRIEYQQDNFNFIFENRLLKFLLRDTVLPSIKIEVFLVNLRRFLLEDLIGFLAQEENIDRFLKTKFDFICSLALQCFNKEYIFNLSENEAESINTVRLNIENSLTEGKFQDFNLFELKLAVFSMYFPLGTLEHKDELLAIQDEKWSKPICPLIKRMLKDSEEEQKIKQEIEAITTIENPVSQSVRSQYEENPYPRWLSITRLPPKPISALIGSWFPHFKLSEELIDRHLQILIAGCGTGREAATMALGCQDADVLAVDLSLSSLAYAIRMTRELKIENLSFKQADLLSLRSLSRQFHIISSMGVIHHLENPIDGLALLVDLLKPSGLLRLGVYSEKARQPVKAAREFIKKKGFKTTVKEMRQCRQEIMQNDEVDLFIDLKQFGDFFDFSSFRDLIFHVNEHCFTIPQIDRLLAQFGLRFIGFVLNDRTKTAYREMFPEDTYMDNLELWDRFEDAHPNTFSSMYSFWCQKI